VLAVLDWELSTLGDPLADFSYLLMNWVTEPEGRSGVMGSTGLVETGIPTIDRGTDFGALLRGDGPRDGRMPDSTGISRTTSSASPASSRASRS
jgi:hypothetical protein